MHTFTQNRKGDQPGYLVNRLFHLWVNLAENPICWLLGHRPTVYRLPLKYGRNGENEYRWIECKVCGRRSTRQVPPAPTPVNYDGIARSTERRTGWQGRQLEIGCQVVLVRPKPEFSLRFHAGSRGSETPWDVHLSILGSGIYLSLGGFAARLADRLTKGRGRDLSVSVHGGRAYYKIWTTEDWSRDRFAKWRDGSHSVNPLDLIFGGSRRFSYVDVEGPVRAHLVTNEGTEHTVELQLHRETLGRPRGPQRRGWTVHWECHDGIPVRNHDWKGDCYYASAVRIDDEAAAGDWISAALTALREDVTRDRQRYEWRPRAGT